MLVKQDVLWKRVKLLKWQNPNRTIAQRVVKRDNGQMREENSDIAQVQ